MLNCFDNLANGWKNLKALRPWAQRFIGQKGYSPES